MMIAMGLCLVSSALAALGVVLLFFLFVYHAIVFAEEAYLRERFGKGYARYCATVNRFWPSFRGARQDLGPSTGLLLALVLMPWWRTYWLDGRDVAIRRVPWAIGGTIVVLVLYGVLHELKKAGRLHSFLDTAPPSERRRMIRRVL